MDEGSDIPLQTRRSRDISPSLDGRNSPKPPSYCDPPSQVLAIKLRRSRWVIFITLCYTLLALFSWVVLCCLRTRPLAISTYDYTGKDPGFGVTYKKIWTKNERWYSAAKVIQAIVGIVTLPTATAVCGYASVVYAQRNRLSLRKLLALADGGYASPRDILNILRSLDGSTVSRFFLLAVLVHLIGAIIWPLQMGLISTKVIKVPSDDYFSGTQLYDLGSGGTTSLSSHATDLGTMTGLALQKYQPNQYEPQLWQRKRVSCSYYYGGRYDYDCGPALTLENLKDLDDPFIAQLPFGFNTGVARQYAPRINSTAHLTCLPTSAFPSECDDPDALHFRYKIESGGPQRFSMEICVPPNSTSSPWERIRDRQDFREEMYMQANLWSSNDSPTDTNYSSCPVKIEMDTTAGMFELPNYMNDGMPGPLLAKDPDAHPPSAEKRNLDYLDGTFFDLQMPGPLYTTTVALFANYDSFLAQCTGAAEQSWSLYKQNVTTNGTGPFCSNYPPMNSLFDNILFDYSKRSDEYFDQRFLDSNYVQNINALMLWVNSFVVPVAGEGDHAQLAYLQRLEKVFTAAAFKANEAWLNGVSNPDTQVNLYTDLGTDTSIPAFSLGALIVISILLGLFLLSLISLAIYAHSPAWTPTLDAFAILRIGAQTPDCFPLKVSYAAKNYSVLDNLPGWIGESDRGVGEDGVGRLALGSKTPLSGGRKYECYPGHLAVEPVPDLHYPAPYPAAVRPEN